MVRHDCLFLSGPWVPMNPNLCTPLLGAVRLGYVTLNISMFDRGEHQEGKSPRYLVLTA